MNISERGAMTTTLRRFSSCHGESSVCTKYCDRYCSLTATFYPNGNCVKNEGHVSIIINMMNISKHQTFFSCTASVIDASGSRRFAQSLNLDVDYMVHVETNILMKGFGFEKFVKRSTLLSDPSLLLPDDILTLHLEISYEVFDRASQTILKYDTDGLHGEDDNYYLYVDTEFGRDLCNMSSVFRDMMDCTATESGPGRIRISYEEYQSFKLLYNLLNGSVLHGTHSDVRRLYLLADKYDMRRIVQSCHQLFTSVILGINSSTMLKYVEENMHVVSELAERFEDDTLRRILEAYSDIKNEWESGNEGLEVSHASKLETEWKCTFMNLMYNPQFQFHKISSDYLEMDLLK